MPKLLEYLTPAYNWLAALDPSLPRAIFVALVFATVLAWRKLSPGTWEKFSSLIPVTEEDTSWFKAAILKLWQALPSALLGAVYGALGTGGNVLASLKLAALALLAPVVHELAWRYQGRLGNDKTPPSDPDVTVSLMAPPASLRAPDRSRLHNDIPDEPAECRKWRHPDWRLQLVFGVLLACVLGCSAAANPVKAPCDPLTLSQVTAFCSAEAYACGKAGETEAECTAECDAKLEARAEECRK